MDDKRTFQLEEYKALRKEIEMHLSDVRLAERYALIGSGLTWGWLIRNSIDSSLLWLVPPLLFAFLIVRLNTTRLAISRLSKYIASVQTELGIPGNWESTQIRRQQMKHWWNRGEVMAMGVFLLTVVAWLTRKYLVMHVSH